MRRQQRADVVNEERIKLLRDFLLVGEVKGSVERYPNTLEVHWSNLDDIPNLLALQDAIAPASCHIGDVQQLGPINEAVVFATGNTNALDLDLETHSAFVLPDSPGQLRLVVRRGDLTGRVRRVGTVV